MNSNVKFENTVRINPRPEDVIFTSFISHLVSYAGHKL